MADPIKLSDGGVFLIDGERLVPEADAPAVAAQTGRELEHKNATSGNPTPRTPGT